MLKKILAVAMAAVFGLTALAVGTMASTAPVVALQITANPAHNANVAPGDVIQYTIQVRNTGDEILTNVVVTNQLPAHTTLVAGSISSGGSMAAGLITWAIPTILADGYVTLSFHVTVDFIQTGESRTIRNFAQADGGVSSNEVRHSASVANDGWWANFFPQLQWLYNRAFDLLTSALVWGFEFIILLVFGNIRDVF